MPRVHPQCFAGAQVTHNDLAAQLQPRGAIAGDLLQQKAITAKDARAQRLLKADAKLDLWRRAQEAVAVNHELVPGADLERQNMPGNLGRKGDLARCALRLVLGHEQGATPGDALDRAKETAAPAQLCVRVHGNGL